MTRVFEADELERLRKENEANAARDSQWICLAALVLSSLELLADLCWLR
jgi:hypothetical protein